MPIIPASLLPKGPYKVARLQIRPVNLLGDSNQRNRRVARRTRMQRHRDETRTVGTIPRPVLPGLRLIEVVRNMLVDPVLAAGYNLGPADLAVDVRLGSAAAAAGADSMKSLSPGRKPEAVLTSPQSVRDVVC
ncbi:hypothetical protein QBC47DRAFT_97981 [Echria macrotheca]|uniref:Uncharacterized protein n=1 Tax=Echria macrotheca TaxID=438768 RepID=A0AAJ0BJD8_9PEZI|nr:hypothetical protein QBC47DRAFT_97981 [Echria macrotheca]